MTLLSTYIVLLYICLINIQALNLQKPNQGCQHKHDIIKYKCNTNEGVTYNSGYVTKCTCNSNCRTFTKTCGQRGSWLIEDDLNLFQFCYATKYDFEEGPLTIEYEYTKFKFQCKDGYELQGKSTINSYNKNCLYFDDEKPKCVNNITSSDASNHTKSLSNSNIIIFSIFGILVTTLIIICVTLICMKFKSKFKESPQEIPEEPLYDLPTDFTPHEDEYAYAYPIFNINVPQNDEIDESIP